MEFSFALVAFETADYSLTDVLSYAPQDAAWIDDHKIADAPGPILWGIYLDLVLVFQILGFNVLPPSFNINYEQMDHDGIGTLFVVELLQQEA